ncbi:hypothetical protein A3J02_01110 [Candidatus Azambacteria bacterium RIFCSPLOWO2_02_FULL_46_11]|uniref:Uncharacterized protein n=1 Tax=Candidatus Azambacteria bacterium RIFCSPLOWO2_02_FULL_46_11 TaxID=1797300 RepID=A0A1F5CQP4_9BACT|nr:MAG: hypothetical protein A3J02_01110 [Candidatus Azambacteria bacterium RIFCSPLOWO2_02_FULL_46_11]
MRTRFHWVRIKSTSPNLLKKLPRGFAALARRKGAVQALISLQARRGVGGIPSLARLAPALCAEKWWRNSQKKP